MASILRAVGVGVLLGGAVACNAIFGLDAGEPIADGAGAASTGGTATGGTGAADVGGSDVGGSDGGTTTVPTCTIVSDCMPPNAPCREAACEQGECAEVLAPEGAACPQGVCTAGGSCVECNDAGDCDGTEVCITNQCSAAHCESTALDGDETDVDCGGSCPGCPNGDNCSGFTDCLSGVCNSGQCAPCVGNANCLAPDTFCDTGVCVDKYATGTPCGSGAECLTGQCADGYCCDAPCAAACRVCALSLGASANGTCSNAPAGSAGDPSCSPYVCPGTGGQCGTECVISSDCAVDFFCCSEAKGLGAELNCADNMCIPKQASGQPCSMNFQCLSGMCSGSNCL